MVSPNASVASFLQNAVAWRFVLQALVMNFLGTYQERVRGDLPPPAQDGASEAVVRGLGMVQISLSFRAWWECPLRHRLTLPQEPPIGKAI